MIVVAGVLTLDPRDRDAYLERCREVVAAARAADGCADFALSADLVDPGRINVFEAWDSVEQLEAFRGSGPEPDDVERLTGARVAQMRVTEHRLL